MIIILMSYDVAGSVNESELCVFFKFHNIMFMYSDRFVRAWLQTLHMKRVSRDTII